MTDLSQAIVNGFAIADTIKSRREQQKQNDLNESYRRDAFSENKRQFNLGLADRKEGRAQDESQFSRRIAQMGDETNKSYLLGQERNRLAGESIGLDRQKLNLVRDAAAQEREDKQAAILGQQFSDGHVNGWTDESAQLTINGLLKNAEERTRVSKAMFGEDVFRSTKDGTPLDSVVVKDGMVALYGTRKTADGKIELAIPDEGRTADNSTPPMLVPVAKFMQGIVGNYAGNPYFIAAAGKGLALKGAFAPEGPEPTPDEIRDKLAQSTYAQSNTGAPASRGTAAPTLADPAQSLARSAAPTTSPAPAPVATSGLSADETAELLKLNQLRSDTPTVSSRWSLSKTSNPAASQLADQYETRRQELLAKQQAAEEAAKQDAQSLAVSQVASARGLAVPPAPTSDKSATDPAQEAGAQQPQEDPNAEIYAMNRVKNDGLRRVYAQQRGLGVQPTAADMAALENFGVASADIIRQNSAAAEARQKQIDKGQDSLNDLLSGFSKGDDYLEKQLGFQSQVAQMGNQITFGAIGGNPQAAASFTSSIKNLTMMRGNIDGLGPDDRYATEIMASLALADVNAGKDPRQVAETAQHLATLYRSAPTRYGASPSPAQGVMLARLASEGGDIQEHQAMVDKIMGLSPSEQARLMQEVSNDWARR